MKPYVLKWRVWPAQRFNVFTQTRIDVKKYVKWLLKRFNRQTKARTIPIAVILECHFWPWQKEKVSSMIQASRNYRASVILCLYNRSWTIQAAIVSMNHCTKSRAGPPLTNAGRWVHRGAINGDSWSVSARDVWCKNADVICFTSKEYYAPHYPIVYRLTPVDAISVHFPTTCLFLVVLN